MYFRIPHLKSTFYSAPYVYRARNLRNIFNVMFTKSLTLNDSEKPEQNKMSEIHLNQSRDNFALAVEQHFCVFSPTEFYKYFSFNFKTSQPTYTCFTLNLTRFIQHKKSSLNSYYMYILPNRTVPVRQLMTATTLVTKHNFFLFQGYVTFTLHIIYLHIEMVGDNQQM